MQALLSLRRYSIFPALGSMFRLQGVHCGEGALKLDADVRNTLRYSSVDTTHNSFFAQIVTLGLAMSMN